MVGTTHVNNLGSGVYCLGTGTSFDIKTLLPNINYKKLTVDNFIVTSTAKSILWNRDSEGRSSIGAGDYFSGTASIFKNYNADTGMLTVANGVNHYRDTGNSVDGQAEAIIEKVYLIPGEIVTV